MDYEKLIARLKRNKEIQIIEKEIINVEELYPSDSTVSREIKPNTTLHRQKDGVKTYLRGNKKKTVEQKNVLTDTNHNNNSLVGQMAENNPKNEEKQSVSDKGRKNRIETRRISDKIYKYSGENIKLQESESYSDNDLIEIHISSDDCIESTTKEIDEKSEEKAIIEKYGDEKRALYEKFNLKVEDNDFKLYVPIVDSSGQIVKDMNFNNINIEQTDMQDTNEVLENSKNINSKCENYCTDDIKQETSAENLILSLNPPEWLNLDEFENIVKELNSINPNEIADIEESLSAHTIVKNSLSNNNDTQQQIDSSKTKSSQADSISKKGEENEIISVSTDDENELKLSISLDDLETISLSSIEFVDDVTDSNMRSKKSDDDDWHVSLKDIKKNKKIASALNETTQSKETTAVNDVNSKDCIEESDNEVNNSSKDTQHDPNELEIIQVSKELDKGDSKMRDKVDNKEMDTISIISNGSSIDYHSSDFEFITEDEAVSDGLIINYYKKRVKSSEDKKSHVDGTCKTVEVTSDSGFNCSNSLQNSGSFHSYDTPGTSRQVPWADVSPPRFIVDYSYRQDHNIPEGDRYLNLFQGCYAPSTPYMYENKSMASPLVVRQYEGLGFDMRRLPRRGQEEDDDDTYKEDATESAKKILSLYREENKKRRRRF